MLFKHESRTRLRVPKIGWALVAGPLVSAFMALMPAQSAFALPPAANSQITSVATATYNDGFVDQRVVSNTVKTTVQQVYGHTLVSSQTISVNPGAIASVTHTLHNSGNGTLLINGVQSAATGATSVASRATLGGTGTLGGSVTVASGATLAPGGAGAVGTLTMGALTLGAASVLDVDLTSASTVDKAVVNGDLALAGSVNITLVGGGAMQRGTYTLISYSGALTGSTMAIGTLPTGINQSDLQVSVDTAAKKVYLTYSGGNQGTYWDATATTKDDSAINGGDGTWSAATSNTNWTTSSGQYNGPWSSDGVANFGNTAGAVSVSTTAGAINITGLTFTATGYSLAGGTLTGTATTNPLTAGNNISANIGSVLAGPGKAFSKEGAGTITLGGANTYGGAMTVNAGSLFVNGVQTGTGTTTVLSGATLGGSGTLGGSVAVATGGILAPGSAESAVGTLTTGALTLNPNFVLKFDVNPSGASDLIEVVGALIMNGKVDVSVVGGGTMAPGVYTMFHYTGTITGEAMTIGALPNGVYRSEVEIVDDHGTNTYKLRYAPRGTYWDATLPNNSAINGGTGTWTAASSNTNWTTSGGNPNGSWLPDSVANFGGTAGAVSVSTAAGAINVAGLSFTTDGYSISGDTVTGTAATNPLTAGSNIGATIGSVLAGPGKAFSKEGAGTIKLGGANTYGGAMTVNAGALFVNGVQTGTGTTTVLSGATLGGSGTLGGSVAVATGGILAPGSAESTIGTLTTGALALNPNFVLKFDVNPSGASDLIEVVGALIMNGKVDVSVVGGGTMAPGVYTMFHYTGTITGEAMTIGALPNGVSRSEVVIVDDHGTNTYKLRYAPRGTYWDAASGTKDDSNVNGGTGDWTAATSDTNWTISSGQTNGSWLPDGVANFGGTAGTVTVDASLGAINITGLNFTTNGYTLTGSTLTATATTNPLTAVGAGVTATINSVLAGTNKAFTKEGAGTIVLGGANSYTGTTTINAGTLKAGAANAIPGSSAITVVAGATLDLDGKAQSSVSVTGAGTIALGTGGVLTLTGTSSFSGSFSGTGKVILPNGSSLTLDSTFNASGLEIELSGGALTIGAQTPSIGKLTISAASTLSFTASNTSRITVGTLSITASGSGTALTINNWTAAQARLTATAFTGAVVSRAGSAPENRIDFGSPYTSATTNWRATGEISPIIDSFTLSGSVFTDNGASSGTANDGIKNGGEAGISGVAINVTDCGSTVYGSGTTDSSGNYSIAATATSGTSVCLIETNPTGFLSTGASVGSTVLPSGSSPSVGGKTYTYTRATDRIAITWDNTARANLNFGDVGPGTLTASPPQTSWSGNWIFHAHTFTPSSVGTATVTIAISTSEPPTAMWGHALYMDANCNGRVDDTGDNSLPNSITITAAMVGQPYCFFLRVVPPASGVADLDNNVATIALNFDFTSASPSLQNTLSAVDTTTIQTSSQMSLVRSVCNVATSLSQCVNASDFTPSNMTLPGQDLVYRTVYTNNSNTPLTVVKVIDSTPYHTTFVSASIEALPAGLTACSVTAVGNAATSCANSPPAGGTGAVIFNFTGTLNHGQSSAVRLRVHVNE